MCICIYIDTNRDNMCFLLFSMLSLIKPPRVRASPFEHADSVNHSTAWWHSATGKLLVKVYMSLPKEALLP